MSSKIFDWRGALAGTWRARRALINCHSVISGNGETVHYFRYCKWKRRLQRTEGWCSNASRSFCKTLIPMSHDERARARVPFWYVNARAKWILLRSRPREFTSYERTSAYIGFGQIDGSNRMTLWSEIVNVSVMGVLETFICRICARSSRCQWQLITPLGQIRADHCVA